ncbi:MAG: PAS domain S-box protein [Candidatus Riflebacteria bacterium]|nr:PAS domain S-box protein [Candidatus Riflebacteria bacterium]
MKEEKSITETLYEESISFGKNSFVEYLLGKTQAFKQFQDMSAFVTSIYRASNYPFFVVGTAYSIQYMNPACLEFTGLKLKEIGSKVICRNVFQSDLCEGDCAIRQAIKTKKPVVGKRVHVKDKNGKHHTIIVSAGAMVEPNGAVLGGFETWRDAMPDEEMASRINSLMSTLDDYCQYMQDQVENFLLPVLEKSEEGKISLNRMKERLGVLMTAGNAMQRAYCWSIKNCPPEIQRQCPAFPNNGRNCGDINYTWCNGQMQGTALEKTEQCTKCSVYSEIKGKE